MQINEKNLLMNTMMLNVDEDELEKAIEVIQEESEAIDNSEITLNDKAEIVYLMKKHEFDDMAEIFNLMELNELEDFLVNQCGDDAFVAGSNLRLANAANEFFEQPVEDEPTFPFPHLANQYDTGEQV